MEEGFSGVETEILPSPTISEQINLPSGEGAISIETSQDQLTDYFEEYASLLGFDGEEARRYFESNVDFTFSHKEAVSKYRDLHMNAIDSRISKALQTPFKDQGQVLVQGDSRLSVNINALICLENMGRDRSVAAFQDRMNALVNHELRHVLQFMTESDLVKRKSQQTAMSQKLFIGYIMGFVAGAIVPESIPITVAAMAGLQCFSVIVNGKNIDMEKDAKAAEKTDMTKLQKRPFNFTTQS